MTRRALVLLAVLLLAAVAVVAAITRPATPPPAIAATAAGSSPAVRATLFCPDLRALPGTYTTSQVTIGTATPAGGSVSLGAATSTDAAATVLGAGQRTSTYGGPLSGPLTLEAQGPLTSGLVGDQLARANKTTDRGWAEARCEPPRSDQWFVGAGTQPGETAELVLANPADTRAVVAITVLTPNGPASDGTGDNLVLAPHTFQKVQVTQLAPGVAVTAVHVHTERGQVSAAIRDTRVNGTTLLGTDWVPLSQPGTSISLPAVPGMIDGAQPKRLLSIANTGDEDTSVQVTVTGSTQGTFVPLNLDAVRVNAQSVTTVDLTAALGSQDASIAISSSPGVSGTTPPIVAGALIDAGSPQGGIREIAYVGTVVPLAGPALVPTIPIQDSTNCLLSVSAPQAAVTATMTMYPPTGGAPKSLTLLAPAGQTRTLSFAQAFAQLGVPLGSVAVITPDPGSGPMLVTRLIVENGALGPLISEFELTGAAAAQQVPATAQLPLGSTS